MMLEFWQRDSNLRRQDLQKISQEYKIVFVSPISVSESSNWHLMLVTQNGFRIFIHFAQEKVDMPTDEELRQEGINTDYLFYERLTHKWRIEEIMHFPDQSTLAELQFMNKLTSAITGGQVHSTANAISLDPQSILYDQFDGVLAFVQP